MSAMISNPTELVTLSEVAGELKVSHEQARQLCLRQKLRHINVGAGNRSEYRVQRDWLDEFKKSRDSHAKQVQESARRIAKKYAKAPIDFVRSAAESASRGQGR